MYLYLLSKQLHVPWYLYLNAIAVPIKFPPLFACQCSITFPIVRRFVLFDCAQHCLAWSIFWVHDQTFSYGGPGIFPVAFDVRVKGVQPIYGKLSPLFNCHRTWVFVWLVRVQCQRLQRSFYCYHIQRTTICFQL